jgi:cytochrome b subunit of formate dehydrogenase
MEDVANQEVAPQVPPTKAHVMDSKIWIIIAALVLLVLLIGGFYLYRNNGLSIKNQAISTNNSTTTLHPTIHE